ncbi:MAG: GNAT family N-acetyltransferase [Chthoniobacterales bacterium]
MIEVKLRSPASPEDWERYYDLRWRVLRAPWSQPRGSERDDSETESFHVALWNDIGAPVAAGRLHLNSAVEAQIRYMTVDPCWARQGLGGRILEALEEKATVLGATRVMLNARLEAQPFYKKHGYLRTGPAGTLFGSIPHDAMAKTLA